MSNVSYERPNRSPDIIVDSKPYWFIDGGIEGKFVYSTSDMGDYFISIFDQLMIMDEPKEARLWIKTLIAKYL